MELGLSIEQRGHVSLEEMLLVTDNGCEYLSTPQDTLPLLG